MLVFRSIFERFLKEVNFSNLIKPNIQYARDSDNPQSNTALR